jgi:glycosyltransferase involved in cell wall biosynthesis
MTKICFASYEIHPTLMGGCGVLLHHSARVLLAQGHEVLFLLEVDSKSFQQFDREDRLLLPNPQNCRAYQVSALIEGMDLPPNSFKTVYETKARMFYAAASRLYKLEKPDIIEFFEYCGVAYHALNAKAAGLDFADSHLAVRLHSSMEMVDRQEASQLHGIDRYIMYGLEHHVLRFAETVLYPSKTYLEEIYLAHYEPWFGEPRLSQPALLDAPAPAGTCDYPDAVLFYGRLFGLKGVDQFVDAAVLHLSDPRNPRLRFYLVGYDSYQPPTGRGSYKEYLYRKIPQRFRDAFVFWGQLSWQQLGGLLPGVLFAVVPSYMESFGYAAHELYAAGVPLIVSDLPAFRDGFRHMENALVFDGTVSDLADKMSLLSADENLRRKISRPYSVTAEPLGDFYANPPKESWINNGAEAVFSNLLVCILIDDSKGLNRTRHSLRGAIEAGVRLVLMRSVPEGRRAGDKIGRAASWFLGGLYVPEDLNGSALNPTEILTAEMLLILKAGDVLDDDYLRRGLTVLQRQSQIAFVGSWKHVKTWLGSRLETLPLDAVLEIAPFLQSSPFNRFIMRTPPGELLIDLFDPRAGRLGELDYLWRLDDEDSSGLIIPKALVTPSDKAEPILNQASLDYIFLKDENPERKERLARFNLTLARRARVLRRFHYEMYAGSALVYRINRIVSWLATSSLSKSMDRIPWVKKPISYLVRQFMALLTIFQRK